MYRKTIIAMFACIIFASCGGDTSDGGYSTDSTAGNNSTVSGRPDSANAGAVYKSDTVKHDSAQRHPSRPLK
jgi:hypothetical protein